MEFKDVLKSLRLSKGFTQQKLADELHFSVSIISKWENGKKEPSLTNARIIAKYFNVSLDYLTGDDTDFVNRVNK